jgi:Tfp pilus assembly protein PilE
MLLPLHSRPSRRCCAGFSLFELVMVLFIMVVLSIVAANSNPRRKARTQQTACRNNLLVIHQALTTYANDHGGRFPATNGTTADVPLSLLVPQHTVKTAVFLCPGTKDPKLPDARPFAGRRISYAYAMGLTSEANGEQWLASDEQVNTQSKTNGQLVFSPDGHGLGSNHRKYGGNLLFTDGHADLSDTNASFEVRLPAGVKLLNPKPR